MTRRKVKKLRRDLGRLRAQRSNLGETALARFAGKLGRVKAKKATSEPQWVSPLIPGSRPISIPSHKTIKPYTAESIIDRFEQDLDYFEENAEEESDA